MSWIEIQPLTKIEMPPLTVEGLERLLPEGGSAGYTGYLWAVAESLQVPLEAVLALSMSMVSATLAHAVDIELKPGWIQNPNLWIILLMQSGTRKSPLERALKAPIVGWTRSQEILFQPHVTHMNNRKASLANLQKRLQRREDVMDTIDAQDAHSNQLAELVDVAAPSLLVGDSTPEALALQMSKNGEVAGIFSSEAGVLETVLHRKNKIDLYLQSYDGGDMDFDRITSAPIRLEKPLLSIGLVVQPSSLEEMWSDEKLNGRGFVARILPIAPPSNVGERVFETPSIPEVLTDYWKTLLHGFLNIDRPGRQIIEADGIVASQSTTRTIQVTDEARACFQRHWDEVELGLKPGGTYCYDSEWGSKLMGQIARIALNLHMIFDPESDMISVLVMEASCRWIDWLWNHRRFVRDGALYDSLVSRAHKVLKIAHGMEYQRVLRRELNEKLRGKGRIRDWDVVFEYLERNGYCRMVEVATGGRPIAYVEFNSQLPV